MLAQRDDRAEVDRLILTRAKLASADATEIAVVRKNCRPPSGLRLGAQFNGATGRIYLIRSEPARLSLPATQGTGVQRGHPGRFADRMKPWRISSERRTTSGAFPATSCSIRAK
jgi:hypothetical protein